MSDGKSTESRKRASMAFFKALETGETSEKEEKTATKDKLRTSASLSSMIGFDGKSKSRRKKEGKKRESESVSLASEATSLDEIGSSVKEPPTFEDVPLAAVDEADLVVGDRRQTETTTTKRSKKETKEPPTNESAKMLLEILLAVRAEGKERDETLARASKERERFDSEVSSQFRTLTSKLDGLEKKMSTLEEEFRKLSCKANGSLKSKEAPSGIENGMERLERKMSSIEIVAKENGRLVKSLRLQTKLTDLQLKVVLESFSANLLCERDRDSDREAKIDAFLLKSVTNEESARKWMPGMVKLAMDSNAKINFMAELMKQMLEEDDADREREEEESAKRDRKKRVRESRPPRRPRRRQKKRRALV